MDKSKDLENRKYFEIDEYLDLCIGENKVNGKFYVYFDSGDEKIEESEIMIETNSYSQSLIVFNKTLDGML